MATVEVDETQVQEMQRIRATLQKINSNPEGKRLLQKAQKLVDPNAVTPDLDADEVAAKEKGEWQKKFEELETKMNADSEKRSTETALAAANIKWESGRQALRDRGYTSEGIEIVEKKMQEEGVASHTIMANSIERESPPQEVLNPRSFGAFNFVEPPKEDDTFLKALFSSKGNDDNAVLKAAAEAIGEVRNSRGRR